MDNLHQVRTPEGFEGWQWKNGSIFLYAKDNEADSDAAKFLAMRWGRVIAKKQDLESEVARRWERARANPIIFNMRGERIRYEDSG